MGNIDEPVFDGDSQGEKSAGPDDPALSQKIRDLVDGQLYGVLCTHGEGQSYGSLVAFAFTPDLRLAAFATPVATRKYKLLTECRNVALVIDNRPQYIDDMMKIAALTVTGEAEEVSDGDLRGQYAQLLIGRHPNLASFVNSPSCAVFKIDVIRYFHVSRFQEVGQWVPPSH